MDVSCDLSELDKTSGREFEEFIIKIFEKLGLDYPKISARILFPSNKQRTIKKHPSINSKTLALD